ncbi:hypothetical protein GJ496_007674 [Pomphorhynchus laevis]|nr:hypothetical protein GJ496_007674 [Pomphorhynchus laevis]
MSQLLYLLKNRIKQESFYSKYIPAYRIPALLHNTKYQLNFNELINVIETLGWKKEMLLDIKKILIIIFLTEENRNNKRSNNNIKHRHSIIMNITILKV